MMTERAMTANDGNLKDIFLYEEVMARLETIVRQLEGGQVSLAESLALYREAEQLSRTADGLLSQAERLLEAEQPGVEP